MWHVWGTGEVCTGFLVGRPEGKRPHGRPRLRWEDHIKVGLKGMGWAGLIWLRFGMGGRCI